MVKQRRRHFSAAESANAAVDVRPLVAAADLFRLFGEDYHEKKLEGRAAIAAVFSGYGRNIALDSADGLVIHRGLDPRITVLEYEVHGTALSSGQAYDNRFASIITVENRKVVHWRDYMDSLTAMRALAPPDTTLASLG